MVFEAARKTFEVKNGQPTDAYLVKIRAFVISILLLAPYEKDKGYPNIVGLIWSTFKYMATHGGVAFSSPTMLAIYNLSIADDKKTAVVRKKEITWRACVTDYKTFAKAKLKAQAFILHNFDKTWVVELKDEETLFAAVSPKQLLTHLQTICGGLHTIDVLYQQNEIQEYHVNSYGILKYIKALKAAQKKSRQGMGEIPALARPFCLLQRTKC